MFRALKPNGKALIIQACLPKTARDQKVVADVFGLIKSLQPETTGEAPFHMRTEVLNVMEAKSHEPIFAFYEYYWPKENLVKKLKETGFVNVRCLTPNYSDYLPSPVAEQVQSLSDPYNFIAAEKH